MQMSESTIHLPTARRKSSRSSNALQSPAFLISSMYDPSIWYCDRSLDKRIRRVRAA